MDILSKVELAELLRISTSTVDYWVRIGKLPKPGYIGRRAFWKRDEIYKFVEDALSSTANHV